MDIEEIIRKLNNLLNEDLELADSGSDILGDYYNAYTENDLIKSLDEMKIDDSTGCILQSMFDKNIFAELTIKRLDSNNFNAVFETEDEERELTTSLTKENMLEYIKSLLKQFRVSSFEYRREILNAN